MSGLSNESDLMLLVKLATISAHKRIELKLFGYTPPRDRSLYSDKYWQVWDKGFEIVKELVRRRRLTNVSHSLSHIWPLIDPFFTSDYECYYQYCLPVTVTETDLESLCRAIINENDIKVGSFRLMPLRSDFITDAYGVDTYGTIWGLSKDGGEFTEPFDNDGFSMAKHVFYEVNQVMPEKSSYGKFAERLDYASWSPYDPPYIPLLMRLEHGYE